MSGKRFGGTLKVGPYIGPVRYIIVPYNYANRVTYTVYYMELYVK